MYGLKGFNFNRGTVKYEYENSLISDTHTHCALDHKSSLQFDCMCLMRMYSVYIED